MVTWGRARDVTVSNGSGEAWVGHSEEFLHGQGFKQAAQLRGGVPVPAAI